MFWWCGVAVPPPRQMDNLDDADSDEEITIDIDTLDNKTLWELHSFIIKNIPKKQPKKRASSKAEQVGYETSGRAPAIPFSNSCALPFRSVLP